MNSRAVEFLTFPLPASRATPLQSRTSALPPSFALLITDTLESPGLFLLCHFITKALRKEISAAAAVTMREDVKGKGRVVMVGVSKEEGFYDKILKKSVRSLLPLSLIPFPTRDRQRSGNIHLRLWRCGVKQQGIQLSIETSKRNYQYLSAQEVIESPSSQERLQKLWDDILLQVNERDEDGLVLIDDVTALLWSGIEPRVLFRWLSSLRTQLLSVQLSLSESLSAMSRLTMKFDRGSIH